MADVVEIAKARRTELALEIASLDEFIRMAEALVADEHGSGPSSSDSLTPAQGDSQASELPVVAENADGGASNPAVESKADNGTDAPPMPGAVQIEKGASSHREEPVTSNADVPAPVRDTRESPSRSRGYIDALRDRVQKYFRRLKTVPAITPLAYRCISSYSVPSDAACARARHADGEAASAPRVAAFERPRQRQALSVLSGGVTKFVRRPKRDSVRQLVQSIEEIRERASQVSLPVDAHLGQRIRQRRWMLGLTLHQLGERIGADIDEIKEHESGARRIDATRLLHIASALQAPVAFFFEGLDSERPDAREARGEVLFAKEARAFVDSKSGDRVIASLPRSA